MVVDLLLVHFEVFLLSTRHFKGFQWWSGAGFTDNLGSSDAECLFGLGKKQTLSSFPGQLSLILHSWHNVRFSLRMLNTTQTNAVSQFWQPAIWSTSVLYTGLWCLAYLECVQSFQSLP